MTDLLF